MVCKNKLNLIIIFTSLFLLASCASENEEEQIPSIDTPPVKSKTATTPEHRVIELYADLDAAPNSLEGIWESVCIASEFNSGYYQIRRIYHLNGIFREIAFYNDEYCTAKNSRNTTRLFGTISNIEEVEIFNGIENIQLTQVESDLLYAPIRGRPIPLENLTLDNLVSHSSIIEAFDIVENRLYVTEEFSSNSYELIGNNQQYLINKTIDVFEKTEEEIDQLAIDRLNPNEF